MRKLLTGYLGIGFLAGLFLFIGKLIIYQMAMSIFPKSWKAFIYRTPALLILIDFSFAGLASPIVGMAGGTIAMLTMITFGTLSALYILSRLAIHKTITTARKLKSSNFTILDRRNYSRYKPKHSYSDSYSNW